MKDAKMKKQTKNLKQKKKRRKKELTKVMEEKGGID